MSTIIEQVARTLWVHHWAQEHERRQEEDAEHELPWRGGDDLMRVAPETPKEAWIDAGRVVGMVEERNGLQVDACWARALKRDGRDWEQLGDFDTKESKEEFAYCLAMEALGSGVSWMDDHEDWGLEVPQVEPGYLPEVFGGPRCRDCFHDAGSDWDTCDECRQVVCRGCWPAPEFRCHLCRTRQGV